MIRIDRDMYVLRYLDIVSWCRFVGPGQPWVPMVGGSASALHLCFSHGTGSIDDAVVHSSSSDGERAYPGGWQFATWNCLP